MWIKKIDNVILLHMTNSVYRIVDFSVHGPAFPVFINVHISIFQFIGTKCKIVMYILYIYASTSLNRMKSLYINLGEGGREWVCGELPDQTGSKSYK